jgi:hypothetical protein
VEKVSVFIKKEVLTLLGIALGASGGWLCRRYVGCSDGTCPITSSPLWSLVWGAAIGGLLFSMFKKKEK